jgi:hypothetical protein
MGGLCQWQIQLALAEIKKKERTQQKVYRDDGFILTEKNARLKK